MRGMTIPTRTVSSVLESGGLLGPDTCGWNYVPGLTQADDQGLALLWCKSALGHNGERAKDGGRQVAFVGGGVEWIPGDKWEEFLTKQKELHQERSQGAKLGLPLVTWSVELPDGTMTDHVDSTRTITEESKGPDSSSSGSSTGMLNKYDLVWYHAPIKEGYITRTLSFSNLISEPVTVRFSNGIPSATNCVFKMRTRL
jgi:hypothetical protein